MCDVIKIRIKRKDEGEVGIKEMDLDVFFMTSHMTLSVSPVNCTWKNVNEKKVMLNNIVVFLGFYFEDTRSTLNKKKHILHTLLYYRMSLCVQQPLADCR